MPHRRDALLGTATPCQAGASWGRLYDDAPVGAAAQPQLQPQLQPLSCSPSPYRQALPRHQPRPVKVPGHENSPTMFMLAIWLACRGGGQQGGAGAGQNGARRDGSCATRVVPGGA